MVQCSFCRQEITLGTGKIFAKNDGRIFYFCSNKCEKNLFKLKRDPKTQKWVTKARK